MAKLPAFQFYPGDWRKDPGVQSLSYHDRGVWFEILCLMHESDQRGRLLLNGKAMPDSALAKLLGMTLADLQIATQILLNFGVASRDRAGCLINRRMIRDEKLRKIRAKSGEKGGKKAKDRDAAKDRKIKELQALLEQKSSKTKNNAKQNRPPSSSSSSSSSSSASANKEEEKEIREETPQAASPKKGIRIPDPFLLTSEMRAWAKEKRPMIDPVLETEKFTNYWRAKSGRDATKLDWLATWKNWILNAREEWKNGTHQKPTSEREKSEQRIIAGRQVADALRERAAELERSQNSAVLSGND